MDELSVIIWSVVGAFVLILLLSLLSQWLFYKATHTTNHRQANVYSVGVPMVVATLVKPSDFLFFALAALVIFFYKEYTRPVTKRKR